MRKSGFSDQDLVSVLGSLRKISALPESEAIDALDRVLVYLRIESQREYGDTLLSDWRRQQFEDAIERLRRDLTRVRSSLADPATLNVWDPDNLRSTAESLAQWVEGALEPAYTDLCRELRSEAVELAHQAAYALVRHAIGEASTRPIHSISSAKSILASLEDARESLQRLGKLTPAHLEELRRAKERAARYRAKKLLDDAEVALAGGNAKKHAKLMAEAGVMLRQDWSEAFPGDSPPPLTPVGAA
jgi:hypothetical protein